MLAAQSPVPVPPDGSAGAPRARRSVRPAAVVGAAASVLLVVAFFLPWIEFPRSERERIRRALDPSVESLAAREPQHADRYRILVHAVVDEGTLSGLDLHHYARTALGLNRTLIGTDPGGHEADRPWVIQRALQAAGPLLLGLPAACALLALYLLARRLRHVGSASLALLMVLGLASTAVSVSWFRFAASLSTGVRTGTGLRLVLVASVAQAFAGLLGVQARTWWRVYVAAIVGIGALATLVGRYVTTGSVP